MNVLLLDGSALAYRSYYAFVRNPLRNSRGEETSLTFGFVTTLLRLLERYTPDAAAVVFDSPGPTFRHELAPDYKAGRPPMPESMHQQLPRLHETLDAMRLPVLRIEGYEADDVLGTLARHFEERDAKIYLVTGDKDFFQLLSERIHLLRFKRTAGDLEEVGPEELRRELGIEPHQVVDFMALCGDSTDNIQGVAGIGTKTASTLMQQFGSLEDLFGNLSSIAQPALRRKLSEGRESAQLARKLVRIATDVPLELTGDRLTWQRPDWPLVGRILRELEFFQLLRSLPGDQPAVARPPEQIVDSPELLKQLTRALGGQKCLALQVVTSAMEEREGDIVALALAWEAGSAVIPVAGTFNRAQPGELRLEETPVDGVDLKLIANELREVLVDPDVLKIGHDIKRDALLLEACGLRLEGPFFDTMVAAYVLNPSRRQYNLAGVALEFTELRPSSASDLFDPKDRIRDARSLAREALATHASQQVDAIMKLHERLRPMLTAEKISDLFFQVEMPLVRVLADMEEAGVRVDVQQLKALSRELETRTSVLGREIHALAGRPFNLNSPRQLGEVLFDDLKLPHGKRTKTGWSTDVAVLERLAQEHELPRLVLEYRQLSKLQSTYADALPRLVSPRTGRIHTRFNQTVASTGRLSSSDPNLQNIPIRTELGRRIREAFVPESKTARLLSADYSQIELRIMAHLSQDRGLLQAFREGGDVHTLTAAHIAGCKPEEVSAQQRAAAKTVNFGVIYGMGPRGLAQQLSIAVDEARNFIQEYFASYPGVRAYTQDVVQRARTQGFVTTLLGRRIQLPDLQSSHPAQRAFAERVAVNAPIQGSAADLIKLAMVRIHAALDREKLAARMILQVHDELLFEVPEDELQSLGEIVRLEMEQALTLSVPIVVEIGVGHNWAQAH